MLPPDDAPTPPQSPDDTGEIVLPAELLGAARVARRVWEEASAVDEGLIEAIGPELEARSAAERDELLRELMRAMGRRRAGRPRYDVPGLMWALLKRRVFDRLPERAHEVLWLVATSTDPARPGLSPIAAVAAVALWLHGPDALFERARELLGTRALPVEPMWLYALARGLVRDQGEDGARLVLALGRMQRRAGFVHGASWLLGIGLLAAHDRWLSGPVEASLERVCDRVAQTMWRERADYLEEMARCAVAGRLRYSWLERVVDATQRGWVGREDDEARRLRAWHRARPYEASDRRLVELYGHVLRADQRPAFEAHVERLSGTNPLRAQRLIEVWAMLRLAPRHPGPRVKRLGLALERLQASAPALSLKLARLYVANAEIGRCAGEHVRRHLGELSGEALLDEQLMMSDYVGAFTALQCELAGITMHHADKHAASRVGYFLERRGASQRVSGPLTRGLSEWPEEGMPALALVEEVTARAEDVLMEWVGRRDGASAAVRTLQAHGARVERFEQIASAPLDVIEAALAVAMSRRLMVGACAGLMSGALAGLGAPAGALVDLPVLLWLVVEASARLCWLYGFDPRLSPELPAQILRVALAGPGAAGAGVEERGALRALLLGRAATLGAMRAGSVGGLSRLAMRAALPLLESAVGARQAELVRGVLRTLLMPSPRRAGGVARPLAERALPLASGLVGAVLGAVLVYDVCEAAQIVLTDAFLARKYPQWRATSPLGAFLSAEVTGG
jgi:hypothetical protein